ncbi:hypothetical protein F4820DRAFT_39817 [Hypoxylon rubiginosum]|uniref:Uncharacterized protein n=1 Tax=Hypoxylon rubiginosum TaxID=110542 RepID=A0ACB9YS75_9PEZI|nr:hypothetical protein F4820DRAFT_39817 [Hypoxylon rubiginosum]
MEQNAAKEQSIAMEQDTTMEQTAKPNLLRKSDILADLSGVIRWNDTKLTKRAFSSSGSRPEDFYRAVSAWMDDPVNNVLCLLTPSARYFPACLVNIVCGMADTLHSTRQAAAIITFGGGKRSYAVVSRYPMGEPKDPSPLDKTRSFVCTVIAQLVDALPDAFEDPDGALAEGEGDKVLAAIRAKKEEKFEFPITIDEAVRVIKALVNILSREMKLFFVFEGCDALTRFDGYDQFGRVYDQTLTSQLADLLCFLAAPREFGRARKLLWVGPANSMPIKKVKLEVGHGAFRIVDHPEDWNW